MVILGISEQAFVERTCGSEFLSDPLWRIKPWLLFLNLTAFPLLWRLGARISACSMVGSRAARQRPLVASVLVRLPSAWSSRYSSSWVPSPLGAGPSLASPQRPRRQLLRQR